MRASLGASIFVSLGSIIKEVQKIKFPKFQKNQKLIFRILLIGSAFYEEKFLILEQTFSIYKSYENSNINWEDGRHQITESLRQRVLTIWFRLRNTENLRETFSSLCSFLHNKLLYSITHTRLTKPKIKKVIINRKKGNKSQPKKR